MSGGTQFDARHHSDFVLQVSLVRGAILMNGKEKHAVPAALAADLPKSVSRRGPNPLSQSVSRQMSRMPRERTAPEMKIRRELHRRGLRFRVNYKELPGRPDIAFTKARVAVFVDGCFWHLCPAHAVLPKNNADWWQAKLLRNAERDGEKDRDLRGRGWSVLHVWEHEAVNAAADRIAAEVIRGHHADIRA